MNWRLILSLSLFGVAMGVASVLGLTRGLEPVLWLIIAILCAVVIGRTAAKPFRHGLMVGLIAGAVAPLLQALLFQTYAANNPEISESFKQIQAGSARGPSFSLLCQVSAFLAAPY